MKQQWTNPKSHW